MAINGTYMYMTYRLETPCPIKFQGTAKDSQKVAKLATLALSSKPRGKPELPPSLEPPAKKARVNKKHSMPDDANKENEGLTNTQRAVKLMLSPSSKEEEYMYRRITAGEMLLDVSMDLVQ